MIELTNDEWDLVKDLFDPSVHRGVKGTISRRQIVDAILWIVRAGHQSSDLPDRRAVMPTHPGLPALPPTGLHDLAARADGAVSRKRQRPDADRPGVAQRGCRCRHPERGRSAIGL